MNARFSVDTHLFRELGEMLVGRDSTALIELVKNAYDADANSVTVHGENLHDPKKGFILVIDDGNGMTQKDFQEGFLRIASRHKETEIPVSPRHGRRVTGAKGIGRLAAHKLCRTLEVLSVARDPKTDHIRNAFSAVINWDKIESVQTLDEVPEDAIIITPLKSLGESARGTTLTLRNLRRAWTAREREQFVVEADRTVPPTFLSQALPKSILDEPLLFDQPAVHSQDHIKSKWNLQLSGEFEVGEAYQTLIADAASWVLEVDSTGKKPIFGISPTRRYAKYNLDAERVIRTLDVKSPEEFPKFQARILIREGDWEKGSESAKKWRKAATGVYVFLEGFRVLPYGEPGNDWLGIDRLYTQRTRQTDPLIDSLLEDQEVTDRNAALSALPARAFLGATFVTLKGAPHLRMLINREGFVPDAHYYHIEELITRAISFATRVRAEANASKRDERKRQRQLSEKDPLPTPVAQLEKTVELGSQQVRSVREALLTGDVAKAQAELQKVEEALAAAPVSTREIKDQQALVRVLASLGTQMAAFVHEVDGLVSLSSTIERALRDAVDTLSDPSKRKTLLRIASMVEELRRSLERQAAYLTDVSTVDARRRRTPQSLHDRFQSASALFEHHATKRGILILNEIPSELKSPPIFKSELTAIFSNLLSNGIKAAGDEGKIRATGFIASKESRTILHVENTGTKVSPEEGEQWFRPFASTTADVEPGLGKGLGLGLTITRRILDEYGATIRFVKPSRGFSTCLELSFPHKP